MIHQKIMHVFFLLTVAVTLSGCEKTRTDERMYELCSRDGGIKIVESVTLPQEQFKKAGNPIFYETWNTVSAGYRFVSSYDSLKNDKPTLTRYEYAVVREADNKILGTSVEYIRIGGDSVWRPGPDSSNICPINSNSNDLLKKVFLLKN